MKIIFTALLLLAMAACKKDDTICYNNLTMGNIDGETIISDQGNIFDITEGLVGLDFTKFEYGRVMFSCDVLKKTEENRYDIRLTNITSVLTKECVKIEDVQPESELSVENPLVVRELWSSGGYINLMIEILAKNGSDTKHLISLIYDDSKKSESEYSFSLRHNAFGEVATDDDMDFSNSLGYVSFPIANIIEGNEAEIAMEWVSHKFNGHEYSMTDTTKIKTDLHWKRDQFEHENLLPIRPSLMDCKNFLAR